MSKYTSRGILKAKHNPAYRDPKFFGGLCCVCKKRPREYTHAHYPHMCPRCRESRVFSKDLPFTQPEVARLIREYDLKVRHLPTESIPKPQTAVEQAAYDKLIEQRHLLTKCPGGVQSLNMSTEEMRRRIAESAARFREAQLKKT